MTDNHQVTRRRDTTAIAAAVLAALVLAVLVVVLGHGDSVDGRGSARPAPLVAAPVVVQPAQPEVVAAAAPTAFTMTGKAFTVHARMCGMAAVFPLDPPGDQFHTVCWIKDQWGHAPSSVSTGTTYVLGHSWAEAPLVLNPMSIFAMDNVATTPSYENGTPIYGVQALDGYKVILRTSQGSLTYTVRRAYTVAKNDLPRMTTLWASDTKNRVVLITCAVHNGVDIDRNVVAYAYLTDFQRA